MQNAINVSKVKIRIGRFRLSPSIAHESSRELWTEIEKHNVLHDAMTEAELCYKGESILQLLNSAWQINQKALCSRILNFGLQQGLWPLGEKDGDHLFFDKNVGGIALNSPEEIRGKDGQALLRQPIIKLSISHIDLKVGVIVTAHYKNSFSYLQALEVTEFFDFLAGRLRVKVRLPVLDKKYQRSLYMSSLQLRRLVMNIQGGKKGDSYAAIFQKSGRMKEAELRTLIDGEKEFPVAMALGYGGKAKVYSYPARDLILQPSSALLGILGRWQDDVIPEKLKEARDLYTDAMLTLRETADEKLGLFDEIKYAIDPAFEILPDIIAEVTERKTTRINQKSRRPAKEAVVAGKAVWDDRYGDGLTYGKTGVLYPIVERSPENAESILRYFNSKTSIFAKEGHQLEHIFVSAKALARPETVKAAIDRICLKHTDMKGALIFWPSQKYENIYAEFELMMRGIPVQNAIDDGGGTTMAVRLGNLAAGMERFSLEKTTRFCNEGFQNAWPFDMTAAMDMSRFGGLSIPAYPYVTADGATGAFMPERLPPDSQEKRPSEEVISMLLGLHDLSEIKDRPLNVLFLRDGLALEDFEEIKVAIEGRVILTVISVRKSSVMAAALESEALSGHYTVYAESFQNDFFFAAEARLPEQKKTKEKPKPLAMPRLHLASVIANPMDLSKHDLAECLMKLCFQNRATERGVSGLPHPLAYADRLAGDLRQKLTHRGLQKYLDQYYPDLVNAAGSSEKLIYQVYRTFVMTHPNGPLVAL